MWTSAFGSLYATLLPKLLTSVSTFYQQSGFVFHPGKSLFPFFNFIYHFSHNPFNYGANTVTLNVLCLGLPVVLTVIQLITSVYSSRAWSNLIHTQFDLNEKLKALSVQWTASLTHTVDETLMSQAVDAGNLFIDQQRKSRIAFQRNCGATSGW